MPINDNGILQDSIARPSKWSPKNVLFYINLYKCKPNDSPTVKNYLTKMDKYIRVYECG